MQHFPKKLLTLLLLWVSASLMALPITREQARLRAMDHLKKIPGSHQLAPVVNRAKLAPRRAKASIAQDKDLYYVFNRGNQEGYVIASGNDQTIAVLGYTEEGEFDYNNLPDNMRYWLDGYEQELLYLSEHPESIVGGPYQAPKHETVAPMVTTKWNQGDPYNQECPMYFTLGRSITGCVATAMAQVLYYQRSKSVTEIQADIPGYTTRTKHETYGNLKVEGIPAGSPIDWDNMLETYGSGATAKQKLAVAQLMHYCGVSVEMDYTNKSSGAYSYAVANAMKNYFGYGSSVRYVYKDGQDLSDDAWDALLYKELAEGRPFYLSGANSDGGHAFVCDGYRSDGCYHINWGWGGSSDGYFVLTRLNPSSQGLGGSSGGYSDQAEAVIGCEPENYLERAMPISLKAVKDLCLANWDTNSDGVFSFGEAAAVRDLGDVFKGQTNITTFTELYNFTGLETIADDAFKGCTKLTTVKLPKNLKNIGKRAFAECRALKNFSLPDNLLTIGDSAFANCRVLPNQELPMGVIRIEDNTFENCLAFTSTTLPLITQYLGKEAFKGCTKLASVTVKSISPQDIVLGSNVFADVDLANATLNSLQGTRTFFTSANQWKEFGTINEERNLSQGKFATLETNKQYYLYNVGTGYYLTAGEAYGTQAVVANTDEPLVFEFRHTSAMGNGVYALFNVSNSKYIFRTNTDSRVGSGVNACFVDGVSSNKTYWQVTNVNGKSNVYTLQIPINLAGYKYYEYLGVLPTHESNAASPTYGIYSDITYADYPQNCQWMLVSYDEQEMAKYRTSIVLKGLLSTAKSKRIDSTNEQAVYDNFNSSVKDMEDACQSLRRKLNFIHFTDATARDIFTNYYDSDGDGEISITEAAAITSIGNEFQGKAVIDMSDLKYFTHATYLSGNSFKDCTSLRSVVIPKGVTDIYYRAFMNDSKLESVDIQCSRLSLIGENVFSGCKALKEFRISVPDPSVIDLGTTPFNNVDLSKVVLYVPYGSKSLYAVADTWKSFGEIREMRSLVTPELEAPVANKDYYVYNVDMMRFINKGEAWGTQAVVANEGLVYQLRRTNSMPEGAYYLYCADTGEGSGKNYLFRSTGDSKIGEGVKCCFVDGNSLSAKCYWNLQPVAGKENVFTLQVPSTDASYVEGEYLGTDIYHESNVTSSSYGLYWDVSYESNTLGCQWGFISVDAVKQAESFYELTEQLKELLDKAQAKGIKTTSEQAVYDNFESTEADINKAIDSLRGKLHYIDFADNRAKTLSVNRWDTDYDGELSMEEAAAVTDLNTVFRNASSIKCFDELRYFTSLTQLGAEAFRGCTSLVNLTIPSGVTAIGENAFTNCTALKYIALLSPNKVVEASTATLPKTFTVFVPKAMTNAYVADEVWNKGTVVEYTGKPVVTAEAASRIYGRSNPKFSFLVTGAPINGEPELTSEAEATTPIGEYDILVTAGTITTPGLQCIKGTLTVERAPLTLTARSFTRNIGEDNPEFTFSNTSLKNREKIDDILLVRPTLECDATPESPAGNYEIRIFGAETANYEITYVNGTLTVIDPNGIRGVQDNEGAATIYDISGRRVQQTKRGVYIIDGKKMVK